MTRRGRVKTPAQQRAANARTPPVVSQQSSASNQKVPAALQQSEMMDNTSQFESPSSGDEVDISIDQLEQDVLAPVERVIVNQEPPRGGSGPMDIVTSPLDGRVSVNRSLSQRLQQQRSTPSNPPSSETSQQNETSIQPRSRKSRQHPDAGQQPNSGQQRSTPSDPQSPGVSQLSSESRQQRPPPSGSPSSGPGSRQSESRQQLNSGQQRPTPSSEQPGTSRQQPSSRRRPGPRRPGPRQPGPRQPESRQRKRKQNQPMKRIQPNWLKEVNRLQKSVQLLIPRLPLSRVIREAIQKFAREPDLRITKEALLALQESSELYLTYFFEDTNRLAIHAKRVTIMPRDMQLVSNLRQNWGLL